MTEQEARERAERLAFAMGITFYVVCSREGDFQPVQTPSDDCEVVATILPPTSVHAQGLADEGEAGTAGNRTGFDLSEP